MKRQYQKILFRIFPSILAAAFACVFFSSAVVKGCSASAYEVAIDNVKGHCGDKMRTDNDKEICVYGFFLLVGLACVLGTAVECLFAGFGKGFVGSLLASTIYFIIFTLTDDVTCNNLTAGGVLLLLIPPVMGVYCLLIKLFAKDVFAKTGQAPPTPQGGLFCTKCGAPVAKDSAFCDKCETDQKCVMPIRQEERATKKRNILIIVIIIICGLAYLSYREISYFQCLSDCDRDCEAEANRTNPLAAFGFRNDFGKATCEMVARSCKKLCSEESGPVFLQLFGSLMEPAKDAINDPAFQQQIQQLQQQLDDPALQKQIQDQLQKAAEQFKQQQQQQPQPMQP